MTRKADVFTENHSVQLRERVKLQGWDTGNNFTIMRLDTCFYYKKIPNTCFH